MIFTNRSLLLYLSHKSWVWGFWGVLRVWGRGKKILTKKSVRARQYNLGLFRSIFFLLQNLWFFLPSQSYDDEDSLYRKRNISQMFRFTNYKLRRNLFILQFLKIECKFYYFLALLWLLGFVVVIFRHWVIKKSRAFLDFVLNLKTLNKV